MLPKVSHEALKEACLAIANEKISTEQYLEYLKTNSEQIKKEQPTLFLYLSQIMTFHVKNTEGICPVAAIPFYCYILLNSLVIQDEIDNINNLFNMD